MSKEELVNFLDKAYSNRIIASKTYSNLLDYFDKLNNSLPNDEASRVSENEQRENVCSIQADCDYKYTKGRCELKGKCSAKVEQT